MLELIEVTNKKTNHGNSIASYRCLCGNIIQLSMIKSNKNRKSCGCRSSKNYIGVKYGLLTLISKTDRKNSSGCPTGLYRCDCGREKEIAIESVSGGYTKSCGHLREEEKIKAVTTHGLSSSKEYRCYYSMLRRCYRENYQHKEFYQDKGITVCDRWLDPENGFENFYEDMGECPADKNSVDRIDNDNIYKKDNCRWANHIQQQNNKSNTTKHEYNGLILVSSEWARRLGMNYITFKSRIRNGWTMEEIVNTPVGQKRNNNANK